MTLMQAWALIAHVKPNAHDLSVCNSSFGFYGISMQSMKAGVLGSEGTTSASELLMIGTNKLLFDCCLKCTRIMYTAHVPVEIVHSL